MSRASLSIRWRMWAWRKLSVRIGWWLFAIHPIWFWQPNIDRHEPDLDEPTRSGWSVVWLCFEVSHVQH